MKRIIVLALYYMFLQYLLRTDRFYMKWVRTLRSKVGYYLFDHYGGGKYRTWCMFWNWQRLIKHLDFV